jgi:polyisoprenoid-binding protein YceI
VAKTIEEAPAARRYRIDPSVSDIRILVYRTGRVARVGHNHVITGKGFKGDLILTETVTDSTVDLSIPVKSLLMDDPKAREESGPDFSDQPTQEDRKATLRNMLSDYILDAENHDAVMLHARVAGGKSPKWQLDADITIRGVTKHVHTPVTLEKTRERIIASGTLEIRQSDFGITPFSVLAGALQVKDEVNIQYRLVGRYAE